jgi:hypothetical protein
MRELKEIDTIPKPDGLGKLTAPKGELVGYYQAFVK